MKTSHIKTVVIGGGTGIFPVTTALKHLGTQITTIIAVSDSGGSTGRIRDEFGFQPVGDLRQSLAAMAEGDGQKWISKLLLYRFTRGGGLKGHNLGNLILTALQDMTDDTSQALAKAQQIFRINGKVIPSTHDNIDIMIHYTDGSTKIGEDYLNPESKSDKMVAKISLTPAARFNPLAIDAIQEAEFVIIGPGDYYASLLATLLPRGSKQAFAKSSAKIIYISNLMTRAGQTDNMTASDHVKGIETVIGKPVDCILINNEAIPETVVKHYAAGQEYEVKDDLASDQRVMRADILSKAAQQNEVGGSLSRSYLRHDSQKLMKVFKKIIKLHATA